MLRGGARISSLLPWVQPARGNAGSTFHGVGCGAGSPSVLRWALGEGSKASEQHPRGQCEQT